MEVQHRDRDVRVFRCRNFLHFDRIADCFVDGAANESNDSRCGSHGEAADAVRFCNRAVTDIETGILRLVSGKHWTDYLLRRAGEPGIAGHAAAADAEFNAVARHCCDDCTVLDAVCGVQRAFAQRHPRWAGEVIAACYEIKYFAFLLLRVICFQNKRRKRLDEQACSRIVPVMALIPHMQSLGEHQAKIDAVRQFHGIPQHRAEHVAHPV
ncbi:hypothetical protein D3C77_482580 [compost metagenome]